MNQRAISLTEILKPPANKWLRQLSRCKSNLPVGVRIVRFSEHEEDDADLSTDKAAAKPRRK